MTRGGMISGTIAAGGPVDRWLSAVPGMRSFARTCVQKLNAPLAMARLSDEIARSKQPLWLEIGGHQAREGWIVTNVNAVARLYLDATKRWPMEDGTIQYVFSDNVIEHLPLRAGRAMLAEARRCMRPGGTIRIVTPDLRAHVEMYLSGSDSLGTTAASHYKALGLDVEYPIDLVRIPVASFGHHEGYLYDFETLSAELIRAGFTDPVRYELGVSDKDPLRGLDIRSREGGAQLAVQATA